MHVGRGGGGQVVVHHCLHAGDVHPPPQQVRGYEEPDGAAAQAVDGRAALQGGRGGGEGEGRRGEGGSMQERREGEADGGAELVERKTAFAFGS